MKFIADLHVHSKYSRATAKNLDLENLYIAAQLKGITVVGTGDFTHPQWFSEIKTKLIPAEKGLFKLKEEISQKCDQQVPHFCRGRVRFILESEISNIYKKDGQTRKNHNVVFVPDLETAAKFNDQLDKIGNIKSDGRPILGLDARNLLEILLETSDKNFLVPAHIWTPWFSLLGSKSGFNSISECFEDLTRFIFAAETGLSSDPPMNWRVSDLDGVTLISNSDAHSPLKIGREANYFNTDLSFFAIKAALQTGNPQQFLGTFEIYPQEGKYHLDGHRKCNIRLWPQETKALKGVCPVCGKKLTIGVLYRVEELADRPRDGRPEKRHPFYSILPLENLLSEILRVGPNTKKVKQCYRTLLEKLGSEFQILQALPLETIESAGIPLLGEAIRKMRQGKIQILPGYDGEFGQIRIFETEERNKILGQKPLFDMSVAQSKKTGPKTGIGLETTPQSDRRYPPKDVRPTQKRINILNKEQMRAVEHESGPLLIVAGPGTGKTHTITNRIGFMIQNRKIDPQNILAVTFTNKAAQEMKTRLQRILGPETTLPIATTFHALCLKILSEQLDPNRSSMPTLIDDMERKYFVHDAIQKLKTTDTHSVLSKQESLDAIIRAKQLMLRPEDNLETLNLDSRTAMFTALYREYEQVLANQNRLDYEDLVYKVVRLFGEDQRRLESYQNRFQHIFVDEYQDINYGQYRLVRGLSPPQKDLCVIGDPDQSIYGFRGSDVRYFERFIQDFPDAKVIRLKQNYRSTRTILAASFQIIKGVSRTTEKARVYSEMDGIKKVSILKTATDKAEATAVGRTIESLVGGTGFYSIDFGKIDHTAEREALGFSDIAVLYRTHNQKNILSETFEKAGIPFQVASKKSVLMAKETTPIISCLKTIAGTGSFFDLEKLNACLKSRLTPQTIKTLKSWCYTNNLSLENGMPKANKFPILGMGRKRQKDIIAFWETIKKMRKQTKEMGLEGTIRHIRAHLNDHNSSASDHSQASETIGRLISMAKEFKGDAADFIIHIALLADTDIHDASIEKVSFMTMHAAKGLEFGVVFIVGCEDGFLPYRKTGADLPDIEEERRLFYVAMTRAKEQLFLSYANKRRRFGKILKRAVSPFVDQIEQRLLKYESQPFKKRAKEALRQRPLFD